MSFTDIDATNAMFEAHFTGDGPRPIVTEMRGGFAVTHMETDARHMRPGDMINGPTQMSMADTVAYVCVFTKLGITPMAVTSSLNMHFLRPCLGPGLRAEGTLVRIGKTLAVIDVRIFGDKQKDLASIATVTYALPKSAQA
jgi:uncharacterized protein (TIGR00369 family)